MLTTNKLIVLNKIFQKQLLKYIEPGGRSISQHQKVSKYISHGNRRIMVWRYIKLVNRAFRPIKTICFFLYQIGYCTNDEASDNVNKSKSEMVK